MSLKFVRLFSFLFSFSINSIVDLNSSFSSRNVFKHLLLLLIFSVLSIFLQTVQVTFSQIRKTFQLCVFFRQKLYILFYFLVSFLMLELVIFFFNLNSSFAIHFTSIFVCYTNIYHFTNLFIIFNNLAFSRSSSFSLNFVIDFKLEFSLFETQVGTFFR